MNLLQLFHYKYCFIFESFNYKNADLHCMQSLYIRLMPWLHASNITLRTCEPMHRPMWKLSVWCICRLPLTLIYIDSLCDIASSLWPHPTISSTIAEIPHPHSAPPRRHFRATPCLCLTNNIDYPAFLSSLEPISRVMVFLVLILLCTVNILREIWSWFERLCYGPIESKLEEKWRRQ